MTGVKYDIETTDRYTYEYDASGNAVLVRDNSTTPLVKKISQPHISFEYTCDSRGNIETEKRGDLSSSYKTTSYEYDKLGQLVRVNDPHENATWVYEYDRGGNITSKKKYH